MNRFILMLIVTMLPTTSSFAQEPAKVEMKGMMPKIKQEDVISGYLTELNGKYKLRVTEVTVEPGGYMGEHHHLGPGIRLITSGQMSYGLPDKTLVYGPGDSFFEAGDVTHTMQNKGDVPLKFLLFEILLADLKGPSLIPPRSK
jgi:quercetin dioxygenase-like cupin family protein